MSTSSGPQASSASRRSPWRYAVPIMALAAGLLFGTSAALARTVPPSTNEPADLAGLIQQRGDWVRRMADQAGDLRTEIRTLERVGEGANSAGLLAGQQADEMAATVGIGAVRGPAVEVTLDDAGYSLDTLPPGYTVDDVVVHQQDVQAVVNALWTGGAEAMTIQDQRVIASSAVQCVGNTLYLQGRVYSPPYVITAIGDVDALTAALTEDPTVQNYRGWSDTLGLGYDVESISESRMPGFEGQQRPEYARTAADHASPTQTPGGVTDIIVPDAER